MSLCHCRWQSQFHVLTLLDGLGAELAMAHTHDETRQWPTGVRMLYWNSVQSPRLPCRYDGREMGLSPNGSHSLEGGVR